MEYKFDNDNFEKEVLGSDIPVLVDFFADWCGPCQMMAPVVKEIAEEYDGRLKVGKCNTDENVQLALRYKISSIPAFLLFEKGEPTQRFVGAMSADEFCEKLDECL